MAYIDDQTLLEIQRATDIQEVVSEYVPLKRAGSNYKGLCPFHEEKTPSFMVSPSKQIFKCFGCQKGGNAFHFLMAIERITFPEAVKNLADRTGIRLKAAPSDSPANTKNEMYKVNEWTRDYFYKALFSPEGEKTRTYLKARGVTEETVKHFKLGYAPASWDDLIKKAQQAKINTEFLATAGLVYRKAERSYYDYFRNRLMFPILDVKERVIGFGGRTLDDAEPKYLNTPETLLFNKGACLYGLHLAKEHTAETEHTMYVVEGYFDMILPYQYGVNGIVATLGTALTSMHLRLLQRYAERVVVVYDADQAGQKASERALDLLLAENLDIGVVRLPEGLDPSDFIVKYGKAEFLKCLSQPIDFFDFLVESLEAHSSIKTVAGQTRVIEEVLSRLEKVPNEVKRELLLQRLSKRYNISLKALKAKMRPGVESLKTDGIVRRLSLEHEPYQQELIELMLFKPELIPQMRKALSLDYFSSDVYRNITRRIWDLHASKSPVQMEELLTLLRDDEPAVQVVTDIIQEGPKGENFEARWESLLRRIHERELSRTLKQGFGEAKQGSEKEAWLKKLHQKYAELKK